MVKKKNPYLSIGSKTIKRNGDSLVPVMGSVEQSRDYIGMCQHDPLGPGIGFYSSSFSNS